MKFSILGQGTALPPHSINFEESVEYAREAFCETEEQKRQLKLLYRMTGVEKRHTVVLDGPEGTPNRVSFFPSPNGACQLGPSIRERMAKYESEALPLAVQASQEALDASQIQPGEITHLVTVSCSGFAAPGVDIGLIKQLGLPATTQRVHVGFMGCHGALNGLRAARGFAESDPSARVLLCAVELCSLHYHYGWHPDQLVANALFADGSAAIVGAAADVVGEGPWQVAATGSCLIPDSEDAMTWRIGNNGFIMSLSSRVPELIGTHLKPWIEGWLADFEYGIDDIRSWAVHPGGPRILSSTSKALGLDREALAVSREVLRDHGNMSSPTILFILKRLRDSKAPRPCVALGFGPGLMAEAVLFV
ncbi:MAG: type III polyketide synthase [Candidatus Hydrogenedentes bacterium]|nr:type III polyketide synthase [Candidatus Hydrogenedentota bacterium]